MGGRICQRRSLRGRQGRRCDLRCGSIAQHKKRDNDNRLDEVQFRLRQGHGSQVFRCGPGIHVEVGPGEGDHVHNRRYPAERLYALFQRQYRHQQVVPSGSHVQGRHASLHRRQPRRRDCLGYEARQHRGQCRTTDLRKEDRGHQRLQRNLRRDQDIRQSPLRTGDSGRFHEGDKKGRLGPGRDRRQLRGRFLRVRQ